MKKLKTCCENCSKKKAGPLTDERGRKTMGNDVVKGYIPQAILDTIAYYNGFYFALCSGKEGHLPRANLRQHRPAWVNGRQISTKVALLEKWNSWLAITLDCFLNPTRTRKCESYSIVVETSGHSILRDSILCWIPDTVLSYESSCILHKWRESQSLVYQTVQALPASVPTRSSSRLCLVLETTDKNNTKCSVLDTPSWVAWLCRVAVIDGFMTNPFLWSTTVACLFHHGAGEHVSMERMGRRWIDGSKSYKRSWMKQQQKIS